MSSNAPEFRLGIIGTGIVAALHIQAAKSLPGVAIASVCDIQAGTASRVAAEAGAVAYVSHREMLTREDLDGVIITAPHALHCDMTVAAAEAGVHVLVEKPMATTVADCTAMIEACRAADVTLAVGHVVRFSSNAEQTQQLLASGELGKVLAITHRRTSDYELGSRPDWFFDPVMAGGGIVMNVGTHGLDRIQWLGDAAVETVRAHTWNRGGHAVETDAIGVVGLANGVKASFTLTSTALPYTDETLVVCENGALRWSATDGTWLSRDGSAERRIAAPEPDYTAAFASQLADFIAACRDHRPPKVTGDYGRSVVAAVQAIYQSALHNRIETVGAALVRSQA